MIDRIRHMVRTQEHALPTPSGVGEYRYSKFHHGRAGKEDKVLFLATWAGAPAFILKLARTPLGNKRLGEECEALAWAQAHAAPFSVPQLYFFDDIDGLAISAEEIVLGSLLSRTEAPSRLPAIAAFVEGLPKEGHVDAARVISLFSVQIDDPQCRELVNEARTYADITLALAPSHGDMTFRNIIDTGHGLTLIDWAESGTVPFWGIDLAHYVRRLAQSPAVSLPRGMDRRMFELLCVIDQAADLLKKKYPEVYRTLTSELAQLRSQS